MERSFEIFVIFNMYLFAKIRISEQKAKEKREFLSFSVQKDYKRDILVRLSANLQFVNKKLILLTFCYF